MLETTATEQKMIDTFIRSNMKRLKEMDDRNRHDSAFYAPDYRCLSDTCAYERKRAVRRILETFLADWS